ncbi:uncharacterized protein [Procambarus clarkii]|uniref:uncharacterized protein n=1 Tax=Procambarus clarkii TaxID=6728 RepID=UPI003743B2B7
MNLILSYQTKFQRVTKDTIAKTKVNRFIEIVNAKKSRLHLPKVVGEYKPRYANGNFKTHKPGNPLRPIISQISSPTYRLAKRLNGLLTPYVPCAFSLKSPKEFVDLLRGSRTTGIRTSLDVESLFTNVPVDKTNGMAADRVYRDPACTPLDMPENILGNYFTKEAPFLSPDGHIYKQVDGVTMSSPLGVLFANFFMGTVEQRVLVDMDLKPAIYCRSPPLDSIEDLLKSTVRPALRSNNIIYENLVSLK